MLYMDDMPQDLQANIEGALTTLIEQVLAITGRKNALTTIDKTSLVAAINEIKTALDTTDLLANSNKVRSLATKMIAEANRVSLEAQAAQIATIQNTLGITQDEATALRTDITALQEAKTAADTARAELQAAIAANTGNIADLTAASEAADTDLNTRIDAINDRLDNLTDNNDRIRSGRFDETTDTLIITETDGAVTNIAFPTLLDLTAIRDAIYRDTEGLELTVKNRNGATRTIDISLPPGDNDNDGLAPDNTVYTAELTLGSDTPLNNVSRIIVDVPITFSPSLPDTRTKGTLALISGNTILDSADVLFGIHKIYDFSFDSSHLQGSRELTLQLTLSTETLYFQGFHGSMSIFQTKRSQATGEQVPYALWHIHGKLSEPVENAARRVFNKDIVSRDHAIESNAAEAGHLRQSIRFISANYVRTDALAGYQLVADASNEHATIYSAIDRVAEQQAVFSRLISGQTINVAANALNFTDQSGTKQVHNPHFLSGEMYFTYTIPEHQAPTEKLVNLKFDSSRYSWSVIHNPSHPVGSFGTLHLAEGELPLSGRTFAGVHLTQDYHIQLHLYDDANGNVEYRHTFSLPLPTEQNHLTLNIPDANINIRLELEYRNLGNHATEFIGIQGFFENIPGGSLSEYAIYFTADVTIEAPERTIPAEEARVDIPDTAAARRIGDNFAWDYGGLRIRHTGGVNYVIEVHGDTPFENPQIVHPGLEYMFGGNIDTENLDLILPVFDIPARATNNGETPSTDQNKLWQIDANGDGKLKTPEELGIGGGADGNNYVKAASFANNTLTLGRQGLPDLTASGIGSQTAINDLNNRVAGLSGVVQPVIEQASAGGTSTEFNIVVNHPLQDVHNGTFGDSPFELDIAYTDGHRDEHNVGLGYERNIDFSLAQAVGDVIWRYPSADDTGGEALLQLRVVTIVGNVRTMRLEYVNRPSNYHSHTITMPAVSYRVGLEADGGGSPLPVPAAAADENTPSTDAGQFVGVDASGAYALVGAPGLALAPQARWYNQNINPGQSAPAGALDRGDDVRGYVVIDNFNNFLAVHLFLGGLPTGSPNVFGGGITGNASARYLDDGGFTNNLSRLVISIRPIIQT